MLPPGTDGRIRPAADRRRCPFCPTVDAAHCGKFRLEANNPVSVTGFLAGSREYPCSTDRSSYYCDPCGRRSRNPRHPDRCRESPGCHGNRPPPRRHGRPAALPRPGRTARNAQFADRDRHPERDAWSRAEIRPYPAALNPTHETACGICHAGKLPAVSGLDLTFRQRRAMLRGNREHQGDIQLTSGVALGYTTSLRCTLTSSASLPRIRGFAAGRLACVR